MLYGLRITHSNLAGSSDVDLKAPEELYAHQSQLSFECVVQHDSGFVQDSRLPNGPLSLLVCILHSLPDAR